MSEQSPGPLSEEAHAAVFRQRILSDFRLDSFSSHEHPRAIILAGQPGAGKGSLGKTARQELSNDALTVDPDELRDYYPGAGQLRRESPYDWSRHTHADAGQWADELRDAAVAGRKNFIFDTTLSNGQWTTELIKDLQSRGYQVEVRAIAAHKLESELGVDKRFTDKLDLDGHGRYVPEGARDAIYAKVPASLDTIQANTDVPIRIFNREGAELYDSRSDPRRPGQALQEAREARLKDPATTQQLREGWEQQVQWHRTLPEHARNIPNTDATVQSKLLEEHAALKVGEGVVVRAEGIATVDELVRPGAPPARVPPPEPGIPGLARAGAAAGLAGLGVAASAYDAVKTGSRVDSLLAQDNPLAAQSELIHYAARGTGGWIGGATAGVVATAAASGPGVAGFIAIGGAAVAGAHVGEHVATVLDSHKIFKQTDRQGVRWESDGRQWVRQDLGDLIDDGQNKPVKQAFSADPEKAAELNYRASNSATELAMGKLQPPRNPYAQAAAENDPASLRRADWQRDPQTGAWDRKVVVGFEQPGVPMVRNDTASPERAAELDRASAQVVRDNIANGPAPIAARYEVVHRSEGWERFGAVPASLRSALRDDSLVASDGKSYQRTAEGQWQRNGESVAAAGNLRQELESTRAALQPQIAQHQQQVAAIPTRPPPTLEDIERADLMATYKAHNVNPSPERLDATLEAVRRTQQEHAVAPLTTSLHLGRNAHGGYDIDSPIEHIGRDADGANRVRAVTRPLEVQMAMLDLRSPPPTAPPAPELRIANLSAQQQEALEQVVREANRLGLQRDDVQAAARQAVAGATMSAPALAEAEPARPGMATMVAPDRAAPAAATPTARGPMPEQAAPTSPESPRADIAAAAPSNSAMDASQLSPTDQAMFAKIRAGAPGSIPDEVVAAAMLSAKRDNIHDAGSIAQVGVANGKLWVGATTPGFYGAASLSEPPPALQDTLRETQAFNREQQRAQESTQRNPDDPSRGPTR